METTNDKILIEKMKENALIEYIGEIENIKCMDDIREKYLGDILYFMKKCLNIANSIESGEIYKLRICRDNQKFRPVIEFEFNSKDFMDFGAKVCIEYNKRIYKPALKYDRYFDEKPLYEKYIEYAIKNNNQELYDILNFGREKYIYQTLCYKIYHVKKAA